MPEDPARPLQPNMDWSAQQLKAIELFGTIDFDPDYDYKRERRRKRGGSGR